MTTIPESMQAAVLEEYGASLKLTSVPTPKPGSKEILVKIAAIGTNPVDYKLAKGLLKNLRSFKKWPAIVGYDFSGTIASIGANVVDFKVGDEVFGKIEPDFVRGTYAEYIVVKPDTEPVSLKPASLTHAQAAGFGVGALTAYVGLVDYGLISTETAANADVKVAIIGASGGVGLFAVQMATALGVKVFAVCSGRNAELVKSLNRSSDPSKLEIIDYTTTKWDEALAGKEVDLILDLVGGDEYYTSASQSASKILKKGGRFVTAVGPKQQGGDEPITVSTIVGLVPTLIYRSLFSTPYSMITGLPKKFWSPIHDMAEQGTVKCVVASELPLAEANQAHSLLATHRTTGKIILTVS